MIIMFCGNIGSSKTLNAVRLMAENPHIIYYTNIQTKGLKNVKRLSVDMIVKKEPTGQISKGRPVYEYTLNKEFWINVEKPISVIIDECSNIFSARMSMSKNNRIGMQWLSLLRKMIGEDSAGYSDLYLITQRGTGVDLIIRDMAHQVVYFRNFYSKRCLNCGRHWREHSDLPNQRRLCRCGGYKIEKYNFKSILYYFASVSHYVRWLETGINKLCYRIQPIKGNEKYFKNYNTLQIDDLFSDY